MYGTQPGFFYLLVGPDWQSQAPKGITRVFRCKTNTAFIVSRVFMDDTAADRKAILSVVAGIDVYPLDKYNGKFTKHDWTKLRVPNELHRFSLGTKNKDLVFAKDGSLTIYVQADPPPETQRANWLPAPNGDFTLLPARVLAHDAIDRRFMDAAASREEKIEIGYRQGAEHE